MASDLHAGVTVRALDLPQNGEIVGREGKVLAVDGDTAFVVFPPQEFPYIIGVDEVEIMA